MINKIFELYRKLYQKHGDPVKVWPQWCAKRKNLRLRDLIAIGAILTQRTSWRNADLALNNLKRENLLSLSAIARLDSPNKLTKLIRPAGFFQTKPRRLYSLAFFVVNNYGSLSRLGKESIATIRDQLLNLYGIGPETADTIMLYALDKPTFIIDEYTKRLVAKRKLSKKTTDDELKKLFEDNLPKDVVVYSNFHTLIIVEQKGKEYSKMKVVPV